MKTLLHKIGEQISLEEGAKMVKDFQDERPEEMSAYYIGREILEEILQQPNCQGVVFYRAIRPDGKETLVYLGIDGEENFLPIVGDRSVGAPPVPGDPWDWFRY